MLNRLARSLGEDIVPLLPAGVAFSDEDAVAAFGRVWKNLIHRIPGEGWKSTPSVVAQIRQARIPGLLKDVDV